MLNIIFYDNKMFYKIPYFKNYYINSDYEVISTYYFNNVKYLKYYSNDYMRYKENTYYYLTYETNKSKPFNKYALLERAKEELRINRIYKERLERQLKEHGLYENYVKSIF